MSKASQSATARLDTGTDLVATTGADARTRIMDAALEAFSTVGFSGSSLRKIAVAAGVQHQLIVDYFKTKDALWQAVS